MKTILSLFTTLAIAFTAQAGWQAPYIYTYTGDPTNVSTSIINPVTGSTVIDPVTGNQYIKAGAKGSNASYATFEQIYIGPQINLQATTAATSTLTLAAAPTGIAPVHILAVPARQFLADMVRYKLRRAWILLLNPNRFATGGQAGGDMGNIELLKLVQQRQAVK